ncbi:hypothetical protein E2C01_053500 [Portunus trituberculatus]|uniref:Uncharacterized protein n=1 Tax=Portunus trituberculatus TaxID=210409 RepID=A0A5B7GGX9_PORTR|nr:hypothetical protein [Portunus trituberculatus]
MAEGGRKKKNEGQDRRRVKGGEHREAIALRWWQRQGQEPGPHTTRAKWYPPRAGFKVAHRSPFSQSFPSLLNAGGAVGRNATRSH